MLDCAGAIVRVAAIIGLSSFLVVSAGCSELQVQRLSEFPPTTPLVGALTYYLPRTAITVNGTVTLESCDTTTASPTLLVSVALTPVISFEPDPAHRYAIPYEAAGGWLSNVGIELQNGASGTLQSFNGTIDDQVGPTIVAALGAVAQIGGAIGVAGLPQPPVVGNNNLNFNLVVPDLLGKRPDYCEPARAGLNKVQENKDIIKALRDAAVTTPTELAVQTAKIQLALANIDKERKNANLVRSFVMRWVPRRTDEFKYYKDKPGPVHGRGSQAARQGFWITHRRISLVSIIKQWLNEDGRNWLDAAPTPKGTPPADDVIRRQLTAPYVVSLSFSDTAAGDPRHNENANPEVANPIGLVIRDPAQALLRICHLADPLCESKGVFLLEDKPIETTTDAHRQAVAVAQFGRVLVLPQRSGLFQNVVLAAGLNPDGTISKMSFKSNSSLVSGLGTLGTAANNVTSGIAARNTAIGSINTAEKAVSDARTAQIQAPAVFNKALAECLANAATIARAGGTPSPCQ